MFSGIFFGYILRNKDLKGVGRAITILIWFLLFILGLEVGGNKDIINGIHTIGLEALVITIAAVLGSVIAAKLLWTWIKSKDKADYEK